MATPIDPIPYLRFPKLDVAGALFLAKVLLQRVPKGSSPSVRKSASILEESLDDLREKWSRQSEPISGKMQPLARRLGSSWTAIRDRLLAYDVSPEGHADRVRARAIHDVLFPDGLDFVHMAFSHLHGESERRLLMIEERGFAKDLARLVGDHFLGVLRAAYEVAGDALGVNKPAVPVVPVLIVEPLRVLTEAIVGYAMQLLALARLDPDKREAVVFALGPIDEYRASVRRSIAREDDDDEDDVDAADDDDDDDDDVVVITPPAPTAPVVLAPVA